MLIKEFEFFGVKGALVQGQKEDFKAPRGYDFLRFQPETFCTYTKQAISQEEYQLAKSLWNPEDLSLLAMLPPIESIEFWVQRFHKVKIETSGGEQRHEPIYKDVSYYSDIKEETVQRWEYCGEKYYDEYSPIVTTKKDIHFSLCEAFIQELKADFSEKDIPSGICNEYALSLLFKKKGHEIEDFLPTKRNPFVLREIK